MLTLRFRCWHRRLLRSLLISKRWSLSFCPVCWDLLWSASWLALCRFSDHFNKEWVKFRVSGVFRLGPSLRSCIFVFSWFYVRYRKGEDRKKRADVSLKRHEERQNLMESAARKRMGVCFHFLSRKVKISIEWILFFAIFLLEYFVFRQPSLNWKMKAVWSQTHPQRAQPHPQRVTHRSELSM